MNNKTAILHIKETCDPILASCCNSAAIFKWPELNFDYVRPGIMLYGASPFADKTVHDLDLKPVMTFTAEIIALNHIEAGEHVGYGSTFVLNRLWISPLFLLAMVMVIQELMLSKILSLLMANFAQLWAVSMDMIAIDVTNTQVKLGTQIELWGNHRLVDDVAEANGTIGYELLCRLSSRPVRQGT